MKEKILAELKKKFDGQLTTKFMESLAERMAQNVKEETEIEGAIAELDNSLIKVTDLQAEGDRRATNELQKLQPLKEKIDQLEAKQKDPPVKPDESKDGNDQLKALQAEVASMKKEQRVNEKRAELEAKCKEKKIVQVLIENAKKSINEEADVGEIVTKLEAESKELKQQLINEGMISEPPKRPSGGAKDDEETIEDIKKHKIKKK